MEKFEDEVLKELENFGKYRVRLLKSKYGIFVDIREFWEEGNSFTKKGVRFRQEKIDDLIKILQDAKEMTVESD